MQISLLTSTIASLVTLLFIGACSPQSSTNSEDNRSIIKDRNADNGSNVNYSEENISKPSLKTIAVDLIGRTISDDNIRDYYGSNWAWRIEEGEIRDLKLVETFIDEESLYSAVVEMTLQANGNYCYDTKLKLIYRKTEMGWLLDNVTPLSMKLETDGIYDDCISIITYKDLYGVHWYLRNNSDVTLNVFYRTYTGTTGSRWEKKHLTIEGNSETQASVWDLKECIVDYVTCEY